MQNLKWGLIGAGDIAKKRIAPALRDLPNCDLIAVNRGRAELAEAFAVEFGARKWFADWRELVADDKIEAVYIATPVFLHCEQTIAAAKAGKHVLCEKPMALNSAECGQMIELCAASSVKLGIAYYRRFYPVIERIKQIIESGEIGKVLFANINAFEYFNPTADNSRRWLIEKSQSGGGPMMDFGCHRIEVLTNLFGQTQRVESIVANVAFEREVEDTATAIFQFELGMCANLTVTHAAFEPQDTLDIFGTNGSIHVAILNRGELKITTNNGERTENHPPHQNVHQPLIEDFTEAVLNDREPLVNGKTGKMVAQIEEKIYEKGCRI
ncbi:MAG: Gfo/Idh/MocA family oxidoreductase [Acidobacteriota bacterium]|nr:Gfo/Idh/MocA family oxidoreductase [Acidobacteriota bacterium]